MKGNAMHNDAVTDETKRFAETVVVPQVRALNAAAQRACAAWWGSFGGSADPEGEWEGLDETEQHYWRNVAGAVTPASALRARVASEPTDEQVVTLAEAVSALLSLHVPYGEYTSWSKAGGEHAAQALTTYDDALAAVRSAFVALRAAVSSVPQENPK